MTPSTTPLLASMFCLALALACACSDPADSNQGDASISSQSDAMTGDGLAFAGSIIGPAIPNDADLVVAWVVSSGSPDYVYKFGGASTSSASYMLALPGPPPAEALNGGTFGVGVLVLLPTGTAVPDGVVDDTLFDNAMGMSAEHAVIWQSQEVLEAMPLGYSCGVCDRNGNGSFDSFLPVACSEVDVDTSTEVDPCNWT